MNLQVFNAPMTGATTPLTTIKIENNIWFIADEVCRMLGYAKPNNALHRHCRIDGTLKRGILTPGGMQEKVLINEPNLYRLISKSKLKSADEFERWVYEEVLPAIRKHGQYVPIQQTTPTHRLAKPAFIKLYEDNMPVLPLGYFAVGYELCDRLYKRLLAHGHLIADVSPTGRRIRPDISVASLFQTYLGEFYPSVAHLYTYTDFKDLQGEYQRQKIKLYEHKVLGIFVHYFENVWLKKEALRYFETRDQQALVAIRKLFAVPAPKQIGYNSALKHSA